MDDSDESAGEETTYTKAEDWPSDDGGEDMTLPSGAKVRVAPPPVMLMTMRGKLPAHLMAIGNKHQADGKPWTPAENLQALDWLIAESFVFPKATIFKKPTKDVLSVARMSDRDKEYVAMHLRLQNYAEML
jgi:hypothetical protein